MKKYNPYHLKTVKSSGHSGRVYLPAYLIGRDVIIHVLPPEYDREKAEDFIKSHERQWF